MTEHFYITNATVVLTNETLAQATVEIKNGIIKAINPETTDAKLTWVDAKQAVLMPGMIDLHGDALEKEVEPRPNVHFPLDFACAQADKRYASAGITTAFHALSFANEELGVRNNDMAAQLARAIHQFNRYALIDNRVHCRYEITDPTGMEPIIELMQERVAHLISLMDHTPGQGQFKDLQAYKAYFGKSYQKSETELDALIAQKQSQAEQAQERVHLLIEQAHRLGIAVASHDDDLPERIEIMKNLGVDISEFPINIETADVAHRAGMHTIMGAPNILRGKSQSGSMKALDAVRAGVCACLCSDYAPAALLVGVFKLPDLAQIPLHEAVALVTINPAKAAKLDDRGEIAVGKRADLVMVQQLGDLVQVNSVWRQGKLVYMADYAV